VAIAVVAGLIFGINPLTILGIMSGGGAPAPVQQQGPAHAPPSNDRQAAFVSTVLADTEDVWRAQFQAAGQVYREPKLVLFRGAIPTACGTGQAAMGPFYCPGDQKVYIDLSFYDTLQKRLGAPGDFAQAYVIAHEVGHHVQNLLGVTDKVDSMRGRTSQAQQNALSVRVELQADCLAGLWAQQSQRSKGWLEQGDVEEALNAASQIGDDTLQRSSGRGAIVPESFTHGTSAQRVGWFKRGLEAQAVRDCDTFAQKAP
jgi:predicted metalloprotease